jgi:small subunit ribosomal protein S18
MAREMKRDKTRRSSGARERTSFAARRASRQLEGVKEVNPRDYDLLRKFLTEHGKIVPGRYTGATARQQRQIKGAIRRARNVGIVP